MAERGKGSGTETQHVRGIGSGEGIELSPAGRPGTAGPRQAGKPGYYQVACPVCRGEGMVRTKGFRTVWEVCLTCDGAKYLTVNGERHDDAEKRGQPTWGAVLLYLAITAVACAGFIYLLLWRAGALRP